MAIGLLALDIDGTLLRSDRRVSPRTRRAVDASRERGVRLVLVTGRRYPSARRVAEDLGGEVGLILHNGALIAEGGEILRCRPLARGTAQGAVRFGKKSGVPAVAHCGLHGEGRLLVEAGSPATALISAYLERSRADVGFVDDLAEALTEDPVQVMFGGSREEMEAFSRPLAAELEARGRIERTVYPQSGVGILDVLAPGVGKHEALAFLQARWGLGSAQTLAIGDNWNDREMLERAGVGLLMGNADPELRRLGLPVLPTNDEDGAAVGIEAHILDA